MNLTRRQTLKTAVAAVTVPLIAGRRFTTAPRFTTAQRTRPVLTVQGASVGATIADPAALGRRTWSSAAAVFDGHVGGPWAATAGRLYFERPWATGGDWTGLAREYAAEGTAAVISFRPSPAMTQADYRGLAKAVTDLLDTGLNIDSVTICHEPNWLPKSQYRTPEAYQRAFRFYAPAISRAGVALCYIPVVLHTVGPLQDRFLPLDAHGAPLVSRIYGDFYCQRQYATGVRLDTPVAMAHKYGLILGLGEFGRTDCQDVPSAAMFAAYTRYIGETITRLPRARQGRCMYWTGGRLNVPDAASYRSLAQLRQALRRQ